MLCTNNNNNNNNKMYTKKQAKLLEDTAKINSALLMMR